MKTEAFKLFSVSMILALSMISCAKDSGTETFGVSVTLPEAESQKALLSEPDDQSRYKLYWQNGDKISVNGLVSTALSGTSGTSTLADFSFSSTPASASVYNFLYPGTTLTDVVNFPAEQSYVQGSADASSMPMYAAVTSLSSRVDMSNLAAVLRFSVNGTAVIDRIVLKSKGGEGLSGTFTVGKTSGKLNGTLTSKSVADSVVLDCNSIQLTSTSTEFFVSVPAQTYSQGIEAKVYDNNGGAMRLTFWGSGKQASAQAVYCFDAKTFVPYYAWVIADDGSMTSDDVTYDQTVKIKVCSFNIWSSSSRVSAAVGSDYEELQWNKAYTAVASCIKANDPDIIGLNEVVYDGYLSSEANIRNLLTDYTWVIFANKYWPPKRPDDVPNPDSNMGTCDAILYKTSEFTLLSSTQHWVTSADKNRGVSVTYTVPATDTLYTKHRYNDSFEVVSGGKYAAYTSARVICCAQFKHNASGKVFWAFCSHQDLTVFNGPATEEQPTGYRTIKDHDAACTNSRSIIAHARRLCPEGTPSVIIGDMNATEGAESYDYYLNSGAWYSSYDADNNWEAKLLTPTPGRWTDCYEAVSKRDGTFIDDAITSIGTMNNKDNSGYSNWRPDHIMADGFDIISYSVDKNKYNNSNDYPIFPSDHFLIRAVLAF